MRPMSLSELRQVWKHYELGETKISALKGVDLSLRRGEFVALGNAEGMKEWIDDSEAARILAGRLRNDHA